MTEIHDLLEQASLAFIVRKAWPGEGPPNPPPDPNAVWSKIEGLWIESDEALRQRLKRLVKAEESD